MNAPDTSLATASTASYDSAADGYNFAYLDEQTKRMLRRALAQGRGRAGLSGAVRLA